MPPELHIILTTSEAGKAFIKQYEGLRLKAYKPLAGDVWTIGWGHTGPEVHEGLIWTIDQANDAFDARLLNEFEPAVNRVCMRIPTSQGQFDAMVSLAYNIGIGGYSTSQVAKFHHTQEYLLAAKAFINYDHFHGVELAALKKRRQAEGQMYLNATSK